MPTPSNNTSIRLFTVDGWFDPDTLKWSAPTLYEMAKGLSANAKFGGQTSSFFSFANSAHWAAQQAQRMNFSRLEIKQILCWDIAHAYCPALPRPLLDFAPDYELLCDRVRIALWDILSINLTINERVRALRAHCDSIEATYFFGSRLSLGQNNGHLFGNRMPYIEQPEVVMDNWMYMYTQQETEEEAAERRRREDSDMEDVTESYVDEIPETFVDDPDPDLEARLDQDEYNADQARSHLYQNLVSSQPMSSVQGVQQRDQTSTETT